MMVVTMNLPDGKFKARAVAGEGVSWGQLW